ncbi:glycosyltransferase family 52 [Gryllotalpicola reticulitermitis]|uniref:Glycosyltransferase family 52 n=1 Tax=Gryllotalpicola reticulitermitis TaxID=1184153 RepID=A0ABV8Q7U6_9MICO
MRELTVSVIMPSYNGHQERILSAVQSVLASTHAAIELIVVDDGSDVPVAGWLPQAEPDPRMSVRRQPNAGQGAARNAGIAEATGEFVFFVDDDDHVEAGAIALLIAHAQTFAANVVVGTRCLVDERGQVLNISLEYLPGSTYRVYHSNTDYPFTDQMIHGRLIRREFLVESGIRFTAGHYEDRLFATELYLASPAHFTNIPTYRWTQYTSRWTSSSVMSVSRLHDKMRSLEACWEVMPHQLRPRFMREVLALDLTRFFEAWPVGDHEYRLVLLGEVGKFLRDRAPYLAAVRRGSLHGLARALERGDWNAMWRLYPGALGSSGEGQLAVGDLALTRSPTDDYFCHTHYHVLFALLLAAHRKRPAQIFIYTAYQEFSPEFLTALSATPWVHRVITYTMGNVVSEIDDRLEADPATVETWLPHVMRSQFASVIDAIGTDDQCFAFNDTLPSWYVIERSFATLTRVEDAYASMSRELRIHHTYGKWDRVLARLGQVFPPTIYGSPKITEIIVGAQPEHVPDDLGALVQTFDPLAAMREQRENLREFFARAYAGGSIGFTRSTVLVYTQPLAHIGHCSPFEQLELYRGIVSKYGGSACVIKPHPADTVDYRSLGVPVMDRSMPAEALNLMAESAEIELAVSFSSSAVHTTQFARRRLRLFGDDLTDPAEIRAAILSFIPDHGSPRFRLADAASTLKRSTQQAARARVGKIRTAAQNPRALLGWPMWKLRSVLDVGRRRLPL